ncbi:MAG: hypothetical protein EHM57_03275 [Actinobacteria bacterium]|nr:MAG: hypothetical protein EHM57_03275 [Actinomycetota bacterium]
MEQEVGAESRTVLIVGVVAIVVLAVATVVALVVRPPAEFDPGTPEATAQAYAQAVIDGDETAAMEHLTPELQEECTPSELRTAWVPETVRVLLAATTIDGDLAEVDLTIEEGGGLGIEYRQEVTLNMEHMGDDWLIAEAPWPMEYCAEEG